MGRPKLVQKGEDNAETKEQRIKLSLKPVAEHLSKLIEKPVLFADDCQNADATVAELPATGGGIALLENLRFYKAEVMVQALLSDEYQGRAFDLVSKPEGDGEVTTDFTSLLEVLEGKSTDYSLGEIA